MRVFLSLCYFRLLVSHASIAAKKTEHAHDSKVRPRITWPAPVSSVTPMCSPASVADAERVEWVPLRVSASHAYVRGLRVSGTIHRAVVRLVRET